MRTHTQNRHTHTHTVVGLELQIILRAAGSEVGAHHTIKHTADTRARLCSTDFKRVSWTNNARNSVVSYSGE